MNLVDRREYVIGHAEACWLPCLVRGLCLAGALAFVLSVISATEAASASEVPGLEDLRQGRLDAAREAFRRELSLAHRSGDRQREAETWFYLGLVEQQAAEGSPSQVRPPLTPGAPSATGSSTNQLRQRERLNAALGAYRRALSLHPESPGALNNLAQVQVALGQTNEALSSLASALELRDPKRALYAQNYADLLLAAGRWRDACRFYAVVATEQPQNRAVHDKLVGLCLEREPDLLAWYLWDLAKNGQVLQVQEHALRALVWRGWEANQKQELLALIAYCLSRKTESRADFLESAAAKQLSTFSTDSTIGQGVQELLRLFQAQRLDPADFRWWPPLFDPSADVRRGMWPYEAFLHLVRSLADRAVAENQPALQETYLLLAVAAHPSYPDPDALLRLANVYQERRELPKLDALMQRYEVNIFQGKGEAYSAARLERIYRYHMCLGVIYSQLEPRGSPGGVRTATFQLQHALQTADAINETATKRGAAPVAVPTKLVDLLAQNYEKVGQPKDAFRLRVDRAEKFVQLDQTEAASRVLKPIREVPPSSTVDESLRLRFQKIEQSVSGRTNAQPRTRANATTVEVATEVKTVAGADAHLALTDQERRALSNAVHEVVRTIDPPETGKRRVRPYRTLPTNSVSPEIKQVTVNGQQGKALLQRGTNLVEVPFKVNTGTNRAGGEVRYVRP